MGQGQKKGEAISDEIAAPFSKGRMGFRTHIQYPQNKAVLG